MSATITRNIQFAAEQRRLQEHQARIREAAKRWAAALADDYRTRVLSQVVKAPYPVRKPNARIYPIAQQVHKT